MLFTLIYILTSYVRGWRVQQFRARLLEYLDGRTSVAFVKVPEQAAETPSLSSKLCTEPQNAYLCESQEYKMNSTRICTMRPVQMVDLSNWLSCNGGLPLGFQNEVLQPDMDVAVLFECEMDCRDRSTSTGTINYLELIGNPIAWRAGSHLAIIMMTNIDHLCAIGHNFVGGGFYINHSLPVVRVQTIQLTGLPNLVSRSLRNEVADHLKLPDFNWTSYSMLLKKISEFDVPDSKKISSNGTLNENASPCPKTPEKSPERMELQEKTKLVFENVTVEIKHNTPRKSNLKLDLKAANQLTVIKSKKRKNISCTTEDQQPPTVNTSRIINCVSETKIKLKPVVDKKIESMPLGINELELNVRRLPYTKINEVLIYSDSPVTKENLEASLRKVLDCETYSLRCVTLEELEAGLWRKHKVSLVAVAGCVGRSAPLLLAHLLDGGRLLALCSDLLHTVLPHYKTAEIRAEVVQITYEKWKSVKIKHHIFCYQASPAKKQFSSESERQPSKYTGHPGHELEIKILASEETWRTPSLLQATDLTNSGIAIFSQIHLEANPSDYLGHEGEQSNIARLEIMHKILGDQLGMHVKEPTDVQDVEYTRGFFLGNHVDKLRHVQNWCEDREPRVLDLGNITLQWCLRGEAPLKLPSETFLPVHVHDCPDNFSTVEYFNNLKTSHFGRVVVYADVISSTMCVTEVALAHGVACVAGRQLAARGRHDNKVWMSPSGHAAMSLQVWQNMSERFSAFLPLAQHAAALAALRAIHTVTNHLPLDIRIKWPNDIVYQRRVKIGFTTVTENIVGDNAIINVGVGVNISNSEPTMSLNNIQTSQYKELKLQPVSIEQYLAAYCNELEDIVHTMDSESGVDCFLSEYSGHCIYGPDTIQLQYEDEKNPITGRIKGIDKEGWLIISTSKGKLRLDPKESRLDLEKRVFTSTDLASE